MKVSDAQDGTTTLAKAHWDADRQRLREEDPGWAMPAWSRAPAWRRQPYILAASRGQRFEGEITEDDFGDAQEAECAGCGDVVSYMEKVEGRWRCEECAKRIRRWTKRSENRG